MRSSVAALLLGCLVAGCVATGKPAGPGGSGSGGGPDGGGTSGTTGSDGGPCLGAVCDHVDCGAGFHAFALPGECCPTVCEPDDCSLADCSITSCATGTHLETPNGACCALCVENSAPRKGDTCEQGQAGYADYYQNEVLALAATTCNVDSDCRIFQLGNACSEDCGTALNTRTGAQLESRLSAYAADHCAACSGSGSSCPPAELLPFCTGGYCSAH